MSTYLVFDLETTGLPQTISWGKYYTYTNLPKYDSSRILSICIHLYSPLGDLKEKFYTLIKPDSFSVKGTEIHGISEKDVKENGIDFNEAVKKIEELFEKTDTVIGHNVQFDKMILCSELYRYGYNELALKIFEKNYYCTMTNSKTILSLEKFPKLSELYGKLFGENLKGAHNAEWDVINTGKCYQALIKYQLCSIPKG